MMPTCDLCNDTGYTVPADCECGPLVPCDCEAGRKVEDKDEARL